MIKFPEQMDRIEQVKRTHFATVVAVNDPLRLGRIQFNIPNLLTASPSMLPWALPHRDGPGLGSGAALDVPEVGSKVSIYFYNDDVYLPVYTVVGNFQGTIPPEFLGTADSFANVADPSVPSDYPAITGYKDSTGTYLKVNKKQGFAAFKHGPSGNYFVVDKNGNLAIQTKKTGNVFLTGPGTLNINMGGPVTITSPQINLVGPVVGTANISTPADVLAGSISLMTHTHGGVKAGGDYTAPPS